MKNHLMTLARYHYWSFEILFAALQAVSETHYKQPCGLHFVSIHGTLNHLLVADLIWYSRLNAQPHELDALDSELHSNRTALKQALLNQSKRWQVWLESRSESQLAATFSYRNMSGTHLSDNIALAVAHVFNHGSHHRGQISAAMTACEYPAPVMDLIYFMRQP